MCRPAHSAHQNAITLLPEIDLALEIIGVDDLARQPFQLRHGLGDDVVMLHGLHWQFHARLAAKIARP